jgi:hypothetical protein
MVLSRMISYVSYAKRQTASDCGTQSCEQVEVVAVLRLLELYAPAEGL